MKNSKPSETNFKENPNNESTSTKLKTDQKITKEELNENDYEDENFLSIQNENFTQLQPTTETKIKENKITG